MEIILGKTAGFCYGVKTAVTNAEEKLNPKYEAKEFLDLFLKMNDIDLVDLENYIKENSKKYSL